MRKLKFGLLIIIIMGVFAACVAKTEAAVNTEYVLTTTLRDGKFVFLGVDGPINGLVNPALTAKPGERITVMLVNSGDGNHDIGFPDLKVNSDTIRKKGETTSITFTVPEKTATFVYRDSTHEKVGMKGVLMVGDVKGVIGSSENTPEKPTAEKPAGLYNVELAAQAIKKGGCVACHTIGGIPGAVGTIGPDLSEIGKVVNERIAKGEYTGKAKTTEEYLAESISAPDAYIAPKCPSGPCGKGVMPASLAQTLSSDEFIAVVNYLAMLPGGAILAENAAKPEAATTGPAAKSEAPELTDVEFSWAKKTFFERCAGCHGALRKGATGPALTTDKTLPKGTLGLAAIIFNGTTRGMPDWGKQGILTQTETETMAKFLQNEPPAPPELSLKQMKDSWNLITPVEKRPTKPETKRDWLNYFIVTLRDAGKVAIIDGDNHEIVNEVDSGYAVHITRMSATGRYAYVIGRDGRLALIDLWMEKPEVVARVQICYDARSVEVSKYSGKEGDFTDKYAIAGCYWPPHFAILDGQTLEPIKVVSTRSYTYDTGEYHPEPRVASILASQYHPEWIVNVKETGLIWIVNYTDLVNLSIKEIEASRFLHDGGTDSTHRYFLVAANQSNQVAVVDLKEDKLEAIVDVGKVPHPGRGANWIDPEFGPVWTTPHLGEPELISIGTDPEGHRASAWKAVRATPLPGSGSLFIKTHPKSKWVWVDMTLNSDPVLARTICVVAKTDPSKTFKCWEVGTYGRAVHFEYNRDGSEVWVSLWGDASKPGETGEIVIYDDANLAEKARIKDLITPTGKFNVYNTVNDIY
jgi:nitrite reductase (NO-forming)/hydroxylamine reductase